MAKYTLLVQNSSGLEGDVCVYQNSSESPGPSASVAWIVKHVHPTTLVKLEWTADDYCFVWKEARALTSGISTEASQIWPTNMTDSNQVTLTYKNGAFTFENQCADPREGILHITLDSSIPVKTATVGIGMSGAPTFAVQAAPNMNLVFTPRPHYWVTFGNYQQGQVLSMTEITNAAAVDFPPNVYTLSATLNADKTWTVAPAQI